MRSHKTVISNLSVCIACHPPYLGKLKKLLESVNESNFIPGECIIGLSETSEETAVNISEQLNLLYDFYIAITPTDQKCNQAGNRNRAIRLAKGKYVTICDSDDIVHKDRLEIIYEIMERTNCLSLLHGYKPCAYTSEQAEVGRVPNNWLLERGNVNIYSGLFMYDIMAKTEEKHIHLPLHCHHAYITFQRKIFEKVQQNESECFYRSEDSKFVRDILKIFGRKENTMIFLDSALVQYFVNSGERPRESHPHCEMTNTITVF